MSATGLPRLKLLIGPEPPEGLRRLLMGIGSHVDFAGPADETDRAIWWNDHEQPGHASRYGAWVSEIGQLDLPIVRAATVVLTDDRKVLRAEPEAMFVAPEPVLATARTMLPVSRRRLREARGLPPQLVGIARGPHIRWFAGDRRPAVDIPDQLRTTAIAVASAVVADRDNVLDCLSWATPTVTDPGTAQAIGATADQHVVLRDDPEAAVRAALELASDERRASAIGWAGRRLVEQQHDLPTAVRRVLVALGLCDRTSAVAATGTLLDELRTPPICQTRWRIAEMINAFTARPGSG
ncbi:MAG: hypothetical protein JO147_04265 [Actinobacteria bacterium]|nr:hypothetical protein [Actinomycetota bacterium]